MEFETLTGKTQEQIVEILNQDLPDTAYSQVPGGANLTGIDPMYCNEALTKCFGLQGYGWGLDRPEHPDFQEFETRTNKDGQEYSLWCIGYDYAVFWYMAYDSEKDNAEPKRYEIETSGYAENSNRGWAFSGAKTSTIGEATKYLLWQMRVYKGEYHAKPMSEKEPSEIVLTFGKHRGKSLEDIWQEDNGYIRWLMGQEKTNKALKDACAKLAKEKESPQPKLFDPKSVDKMTFQNDWIAMLNAAIEHLVNVTDIEKAKQGIKERFEGKATVLEGWEYLRDEYKEVSESDDEVF